MDNIGNWRCRHREIQSLLAHRAALGQGLIAQLTSPKHEASRYLMVPTTMAETQP